MGFITATALFLLAVTAVGSVVVRAVGRALARRRFVAEHTAPQDPDVVITLIHGTWARDASWTHADSELCVALRAAFPQARLVPFVWSGANTMAGRRKGSRALVTQLRASIHRHAEARHYIIAHSHGGNIAMYALRENDIERRVDGLVCLSTPFLHVRPREIPRIAKFALVGSALMLPLMLREIVAEWCCTSDQVVITEWLGVPLALAAGVLLIVVLPAAAIRTSLGVSLPQLEPSRCLLIRASGDEASAALGTLQLMNWMVTVFWVRPAELLQAGYDTVLEWSASLSRYDRRVGWSVVAAALCLALGARVADSIAAGIGDVLVGLGLCGLSAALAFALVRLAPGNFLVYGFFLLGMMFAPLPLLLALVLLPFGPGLAPFATLLDVSAEPTPPGAWTIYQFPTRPLEHAFPLMHSASYQLPEAISLAVTWIRQRQTGRTHDS